MGLEKRKKIWKKHQRKDDITFLTASLTVLFLPRCLPPMLSSSLPHWTSPSLSPRYTRNIERNLEKGLFLLQFWTCYQKANVCQFVFSCLTYFLFKLQGEQEILGIYSTDLLIHFLAVQFSCILKSSLCFFYTSRHLDIFEDIEGFRYSDVYFFDSEALRHSYVLDIKASIY